MAKMRSKKKTGRTGKRTQRDARALRRRRLLSAMQGRRLDEAYLNFEDIRADIEAEAASHDPDALVTEEMLAHLRELIEEKRKPVGRAPAPLGARGAAPAEALGKQVLDALSEQEAGARALPPLPAPKARRGAAAPPAVEIFATPRLFFSTDTVVVVPGFLASSLSDTVPGGYGLIWVDPKIALHDELGELQLATYDGSELDRDPAVRINAQGALPYFYDFLRLDLEVRRYTVEIFGVDWRKDLEIAAGMLAARLRALASQSQRPIHVVAHSQGAQVARRALTLLDRAEARRIVHHLVLLGPANYGSFSAAFALAGNHSLMPLIRKLAVEPKQGFQQVLASMSGVYQLLPFDRVRIPWLALNDYSKPAFWKAPIDAARLSQFYGWARAIDTQFLNDRTTVILGDNQGAPTTGGLVFRGTVLQDAPEFALRGDGTVPHTCAVLPGTKTYLATGTEHSMLATYRKVIDAVRNILADRPVGLQQVSSNPADHLSPLVGAARGLGAPGIRVSDAPSRESTRKSRTRPAKKRTTRRTHP